MSQSTFEENKALIILVQTYSQIRFNDITASSET